MGFMAILSFVTFKCDEIFGQIAVFMTSEFAFKEVFLKKNFVNLNYENKIVSLLTFDTSSAKKL